MITVNIISNLFIISHYHLQDASGSRCIFHRDFFSEKVQQNIYSLPLFKRKQPFELQLTKKQDSEVKNIMQKIKDEQDSGYIFSADLNRTYIMELIHFLMKVHQLNNVISPTSFN